MRAAVAFLLLALGCDGESDVQCMEPVQEDPLHLVSRLDLLLVIGNAGSMAEEQAEVAGDIEPLVDRLRELPRGLPDLHAAVITDDGPTLVMRDECPPLTDGNAFISDVLFDAHAGARAFNYTGDLAEQLGCMAVVGASEDGVQYPLASLTAAIEDDASGFRRPAAALAIVIVTDGEDASPDDVAAYAARVRARARYPTPVAVSVVSGGPDGCALDGFTDAAPAPRLAAFAEALAGDASPVSLCGTDPLLGGIAAALAGHQVGACIDNHLADPPDCRVHDLTRPGEDGQAEYAILPCDQAGPPCFAIATDPLRCADTRSHLRLSLDRGGRPPPAGSSTAAVCRVAPDCPQ
jgi:hypothetical protein